MGREIEFVILCAEGPSGNAFNGALKGVDLEFEKISTAGTGLCLISVWAANVRHPLNSEVEDLVHAFQRFPFYAPHLTALTVLADDGTIEEMHRHGNFN